jgi:hypothetical protein
VRYYPSRGAYYCQLNGRQHRLGNGPDDFGNGSPPGPNWLAAQAEFKRLFEQTHAAAAGPAAADLLPLAELFDDFLVSLETRRAPGTLKLRLQQIRLFLRHYPGLRVGDLKKYHVEQVAARMRAGAGGRPWGPARERIFVDSLLAALGWAVKTDRIPKNPLAGYEVPRPLSRARDAVLSPADHARVLADLAMPRQRWLRAVVVALENTGARPAEIAQARGGDWHDGEPYHGALVYFGHDKRRCGEFRHKTAGKKDRVIYFTGEARELVRSLVSGLPPDGLIFPSARGRAYGTQSLAKRFGEVGARSGGQGLVLHRRGGAAAGQGRVHRARVVPARTRAGREEGQRPRQVPVLGHRPRGATAHPARGTSAAPLTLLTEDRPAARRRG